MQTDLAEKLYLQANAYNDQGMYTEAITTFLQALQVNPNYYEARLELANLYV